MLDSQLAQHRDRLIDLLSFAGQYVPYYRRAISLPAEDLVSNSYNWSRVPLLTKQQIRENWTDFLPDPDAADSPTTQVVSTSGSTGMPLRIVRPKLELRAQTKRLWTARARWHPKIMRWRLLLLYPGSESTHQNTLWSNTGGEYLDLSSCALASQVNVIDDYQPNWMYGSPSAICRLAHCCRQKQESISSLELIEVTGEQLFDHQRTLIESVLGCPVVNHYACEEIWVLSYECPARSMHAWTDDLLLEVLKDGWFALPSEVGELVITSLTNRVMPLIRYRLGDSVQMSPSDCPCGDPRPILNPIGGRVGVFIATREKVISTRSLAQAFERFILKHKQC